VTAVAEHTASSVQINHRQLLDGMFAVCAVPAKQFKAVCSSIDKLDKASWSTVRAELIKDKHLTATIVDALEPLVCIRGVHQCAHSHTSIGT
jgi:histidyl-tRNA synthetase